MIWLIPLLQGDKRCLPALNSCELFNNQKLTLKNFPGF